MTTYLDPTGKPYPPHMQVILAKCRAYDERGGVLLGDVTPGGYGPGEDTNYDQSLDPERLPAPDAVTVQRLRNSISEGRTVLLGNPTASKRAMTERAVNAAQQRLAKLMNHDV